MSERVEVNRHRIFMRADGAEFSWTPNGDAHANLHAGWKVVYSEGPPEFLPDKATSRHLDATTMSQRERSLIAENARLRNQLATAQGIMEPGEVPLPPMNLGIDLTNVLDDPTVEMPTDDVRIDLPEGVTLIAKKDLHLMKKENLILHAHRLNPNIDIPDRADKATLVDLCLEMQKRATA